jgi:hypothetical protein
MVENGDGSEQREPVAFADLTEPAGGYGPLALPLPAAAELLGVPLTRVRAAAERVEPYVHTDGSGRWSLRLLERDLGRPKRSGRGRHGGPGTRPTTGTSSGPDG